MCKYGIGLATFRFLKIYQTGNFTQCIRDSDLDYLIDDYIVCEELPESFINVIKPIAESKYILDKKRAHRHGRTSQRHVKPPEIENNLKKKLDEILEEMPINESEHRLICDYYDEETIELVFERDRYIFNKFPIFKKTPVKIL